MASLAVLVCFTLMATELDGWLPLLC